MPAPTVDNKPIVAAAPVAAANPPAQSVERPTDSTHKRRNRSRSRDGKKKSRDSSLERDRSNSSYEFSAEKGWPENFRPVTAVDKGPHTEFATTPSKAGLVKPAPPAAPAAAPAAAAAPVDLTALPMQPPLAAPAPAAVNRPTTMNMGALNAPALPTPYAPAQAAMAAPPPMMSAVPPSPSGGFRATVPPSPAHAASTTMLGSGSHQEMVLPLSEAAPELFGGNPAASTPHYDAVGAAGVAGTAAPMPTLAAGGAAAGRAIPVGAAAPAYSAVGAVPPSPSGGFRATVPPSPAHAASTAILGSGSHQEMVLPLSEAAPELFGGNPAASTPHYDAMAAAPTAPAVAGTAAPFVPSAPVTATPMNYATPLGGAAGLPTPVSTLPRATPAYSAAGAVPPSPSGGIRATVPPSPAHAASTAVLGSGSHQEMVLPLSEAAPELFGGNPAASTPHYDAMAAAAPAATAAPITQAAAAPFVPSAPVTATPMNYAPAAPAVTSAAAPAYSAAGAVPPSPSGGLRATVPPSPAHAASTTMLGSGSHQEMVLPLSEAAPELFGGNPAASTPHYDAMAAPQVGAPGLAAAAGYMGGTVTPSAAPAMLPPISSSSVAAMPKVRQPNLSLGTGAPATAAMPTQFPHITGFNSVVPPSPAHGASSTMLPEGGHQEMVLPLSEAAPELFGGNPGASTPHYDAVMGM